MNFNFFSRKKPKIFVKCPSEYYNNNINEILSPTERPNWLKALKSENPTPMELLNNNIFNYGNVRNCPAIVDLIKNTLSIKAPADLIFHYFIDENGEISYRYICPWKMVMESHNLEIQAGPQSILNEYYVNTKIVTPFKIYSNKKIRLMYIDPWLHTYNKINVIPGMVELTPNFSLDLNVNYLIPKELISNDLVIKISKGDVLAYLYSPDFKVDEIEIISEFVNIEPLNVRYSFVNDYFKRTK